MSNLIKYVGAIVFVVGILLGAYEMYVWALIPGAAIMLVFVVLGAIAMGISEVIYLLERIRDKTGK